MSIDWISVNEPAPQGEEVWAWNGKPHVARVTVWGFNGPDGIPLKGVTDWAHIVAPGETA